MLPHIATRNMSYPPHPLNELFSIPSDIINIRESEISQKGIIACRKITANEEIHSLTPKVSILSNRRSQQGSPYRGDSCSRCWFQGELPLRLSDGSKLIPPLDRTNFDKKTKVMLRCKCCRTNLYCSLKCQFDDWVIHSFECLLYKKFQRVSKGQLSDNFTRLLIRTMAQVLLSDNFRQQLLFMCSHTDIIENRRQYHDLMRNSTKLINTLTDDWQPAQVRHICCVLLINSMKLSDTYGYEIGDLFDPMLSLFNHSCAPNAEIVFNDQWAFIISNVDIEAGEEIFVSYGLREVPRFLRKLEMQSNYFFDCVCNNCSMEFDERQVIRCRDCQHVIWDFPFLQYVHGEMPPVAPKGTSVNICCQENFQKVQKVQLQIFKDYQKWIGLNENIMVAGQDQNILDYILSKCYNPPRIDLKYLERYQPLISESLVSPILIPPINFPFSEFLSAMELYIHNGRGVVGDPLIHLILLYCKNFMIITTPRTSCTFLLKLFQLVEVLFMLGTVDNFFINTVDDKFVLKKMTLTISLLACDGFNKFYKHDSAVYHRNAVVLYNLVQLFSRGGDSSAMFNYLTKRWYLGGISFGKLNDSVDEFCTVLQRNDKRFTNWDSSIFYVDKSVNVEGILDDNNNYIMWFLKK